MKTANDLSIEFSEVPSRWQLCFCDGCPRHSECLRYAVGQIVPSDLTWGPAIYPTAYQNGSCKHFKEVRIVRDACGFKHLFSEVKQKDDTPLREQLKKYLGGHGTYYRYDRGERLLTPEQQQWIIRLFESYGYKDNLTFEHYRNIVDFT